MHARHGVGCQNSAMGLDLAFYALRSYSLTRPPRTPGTVAGIAPGMAEGPGAAARAPLLPQRRPRVNLSSFQP